MKQHVRTESTITRATAKLDLKAETVRLILTTAWKSHARMVPPVQMTLAGIHASAVMVGVA